MESKYSIIIPHYNMPDLLKRLIVSIPEKEDIQVIVVDDCSPDAGSYLSKYDFLHRTNVEFYIAGKNGGGGAARNIGLKHAKGKWILFADSDDFFVKGFESIIEEYYNSDCDVIYFNIDSVESDDVSKKSDRSNSKESLFVRYKATKDDSIFRLDYPEPWGKMIRRQFIEDNKILFDETRVANDYYFSIQVGCLARKVSAVNKKIYILTNRVGSVSHAYADTIDKLMTRIDVYKRVDLFLKKHNINMKPSPLRGLMVLLMKKSPKSFLKTLVSLHKEGINIYSLCIQMFNPKYFSKK
jgi:glycosyltransferase involved in cell wall biosynthesis